VTETLSTSAIDEGFDKFGVFAQVHRGESLDEMLDAIDAFQESIGIDKDVQRHLYERIMSFKIDDAEYNESHFGWILCGIMIGLCIAQQEA
jgi:hypothetical protein